MRRAAAREELQAHQDPPRIRHRAQALRCARRRQASSEGIASTSSGSGRQRRVLGRHGEPDGRAPRARRSPRGCSRAACASRPRAAVRAGGRRARAAGRGAAASRPPAARALPAAATAAASAARSAVASWRSGRSRSDGERERVGERLGDQQPQRVAAARVVRLVLDDRQQLVGREPLERAGRHEHRRPPQARAERDGPRVGDDRDRVRPDPPPLDHRQRAQPPRHAALAPQRSHGPPGHDGLRERQQRQRDGVPVDRRVLAARRAAAGGSAARPPSRSPRAAAPSPRARRAPARHG